MTEQIGLRGWFERLKIEAPQWSKTLPQLPRLVHQALLHRQEPGHANDEAIRQILAEQRKTNRLLQGLVVFGVAVGVGMVAARVWLALAYGYGG
jgi:ubiquinone biosynthesis protein